MMQTQRLQWAASYLAIVQFLFFTTWIVYIVYLGDLLEQIGLGKHTILWVILFDQLVFAIMDILMGFGSDRAARLMRQVGPFIVAINTVSCLGFIAMPWIASNGDTGSIGQTLWVIALLLWIATSSVLRAPTFMLLAKHAAAPQMPSLVAINLAGLAIGAALAPYLGTVLKTLDPMMPFMVTAVTLWIATIGIIYVERFLQNNPAKKDEDNSANQNEETPHDFNARHPSFTPLLLTLSGGAILLALGFQLHIFVNSKAHYLQFVQADQLVWLLPVFWIGFNLLIFPASKFSKKHDALTILLWAFPLGVIALWLVSVSIDLNMLVVAQLLAGSAWGILLMAGIATSLAIGGKSHGGLILGLWFSMLAIGAMVRVLIMLGDFHKQADMSIWLHTLPILSWFLAAVCFYFARRFYQQYKASF